MLNISKVAEPLFFTEHKKQHRPQAWADLKSVATDLRQHMMQNEQTISETALCTYCERKITLENSHIDHVRPKDPAGDYAHLFGEYNNLTVSCVSKNSCGNKKGNEYDETFIDPIKENPGDFMTYELATAKVVAVKESAKDRVERTCEILGLNSCFELVNARKKILNALYKKPDKGEAIVAYFHEFPSLIDFYRKTFLAKNGQTKP